MEQQKQSENVIQTQETTKTKENNPKIPYNFIKFFIILLYSIIGIVLTLKESSMIPDCYYPHTNSMDCLLMETPIPDERPYEIMKGINTVYRNILIPISSFIIFFALSFLLEKDIPEEKRIKDSLQFSFLSCLFGNFFYWLIDFLAGFAETADPTYATILFICFNITFLLSLFIISRRKKNNEEYRKYPKWSKKSLKISWPFLLVGLFLDFIPYNIFGNYWKPNIYLYSDEPLHSVNVNLDIYGELTATYPQIDVNNTWTVDVEPGGRIFLNEREYNYLYWEGTRPKEYKITSGWCVAKEDTINFLEEKLTQLGLSEREQDDFISYWMPHLYNHKYNIITFDTTEYIKDAKLSIDPKPETVIRVFMTYYGSDNFVNITEPETLIKTPERTGFTVVEWGGSEVSKPFFK